MATQYTAGLTVGQVLTAATMNSIGATWESYTPTFVNITVGNGVLVARYSRINKNVNVVFKLTCGSTTVIGGGGGISMSLPVTATTTAYALGAHLIGTASSFDQSAGTNYQTWVRIDSSTTVAFGYMTSFRYQEIFGTGPMTWAVNDVLSGTFSYEAA
jgi:hypothetical protein